MIPNTISESRAALVEHWQPTMRKCAECGTWHYARTSMSRFRTIVFCSDNCEFEYSSCNGEEENGYFPTPDYSRLKHLFVR